MKRKALTKTIFSFALTLLMTATMALPVFAAGDPVIGSEGNSPEVALTKVFQMPEGTVTAASTFNFTAEKKDVNGNATTGAKDTMPAISIPSLTFSSGDSGSTSLGVKTVAKQTAGDILSGLTWPHAGVFTYTITEAKTGYTIVDSKMESLAYSDAVYDLVVYVRDGASDLYVHAVSAIVKTVDTTSQAVGDKVNSSPGGAVATFSKMTFTNTYIAKTGDTNEDPESGIIAFELSKEVTGAFADRSKSFSFDVTLTSAAFIPAGATYTGYIIDDDGEVLGSSQTFTTGILKTIQLKHGQSLIFPLLPVGTTYLVEESADADYTASYEIIVGGGAPISLSNPSPNTALSTTSRIILAGDNSSAFSNEYKEVTIAGLSTAFLPYLALLAIVLAAGAVMVATRKKKATTT